MGALVASRADGLVYAAPILPLVALSIVSSPTAAGRRRRVTTWSAFLAIAVVIGALGAVDLLTRTGTYLDAIEGQLRLGVLAVVASSAMSVAVVAAWPRWSGLRELAARVAAPLAAVAAVAAVVIVAGAWFLRPEVQVASGDVVYSGVETIQRRDGLAVEPARSYGESTVLWMSWYLGVRAWLPPPSGCRSRRGEWCADARPALVGVVLVGVPTALVYWWEPTITPDQLWASRRFVPAVLPALAVFAAVAFAAVSDRVHDRVPRPPVRAALGVAAALVLLVPIGMTTWPLREQRTQSGYLQPVQELCERIGDDDGGHPGRWLCRDHPAADDPELVRCPCCRSGQGVPERFGRGDLRTARGGRTPPLPGGDR